MNARSTLLLLALALTMVTFHQCSVDDNENLAPVPISIQPLFKVVDIEEDQNLRDALRQLSQDSAALILPKFYAPQAVLGRDMANNLIHYTLPIYKDVSSGFQNLVITLTPEKDVYARIFTYTSSDPKQSFSGSRLKDFNGSLVISDIYGNQQFEAPLADGKQHASENANGRTAANCLVTTYYTTVSWAGGSTTSVDYVTVSDCRSSGGSIPSISGGSSNFGIEYGNNTGGAGGGVAVVPSSSGLSQVIGDLCEGTIRFKHHAHAFSATVSNVGGDFHNSRTGKMIRSNIGVTCVSMPEYRLSNTYEASDKFTRIVNSARHQVVRNLNSGLIPADPNAIRQQLINIIKSELTRDFPGARFSTSPCEGNIPHKVLSVSDYTC